MRNSVSAQNSGIDGVLAALADPTRRAIIEQLNTRGECAVGDIAMRFDISTPAISRHLRVLEKAGLIERRVDRQFRLIRARPGALEPVGNWVDRQRRHWNAALDRLEAAIAKRTAGKKKS